MSNKLSEFLAAFEEPEKPNGQDVVKETNPKENPININEERNNQNNEQPQKSNPNTGQVLNAAGRPVVRRRIQNNETQVQKDVPSSQNQQQEDKPASQKLKLKPKLKLNIPSKTETKERNEEETLKHLDDIKHELEKDIKEENEGKKHQQRRRMMQTVQNLDADDQKALDQLYLKSGTPAKFKDKWYALHQKAMDSDKNTQINSKIRRGKFRFDKDGNLEILPEHETVGKTVTELLHEQWKIN